MDVLSSRILLRPSDPDRSGPRSFELSPANEIAGSQMRAQPNGLTTGYKASAGPLASAVRACVRCLRELIPSFEYVRLRWVSTVLVVTNSA